MRIIIVCNGLCSRIQSPPIITRGKKIEHSNHRNHDGGRLNFINGASYLNYCFVVDLRIFCNG